MLSLSLLRWRAYGFVTYLMKDGFTFTPLRHGNSHIYPYATMSLTALIVLVTLTFDRLTINRFMVTSVIGFQFHPANLCLSVLFWMIFKPVMLTRTWPSRPRTRTRHSRVKAKDQDKDQTFKAYSSMLRTQEICRTTFVNPTKEIVRYSRKRSHVRIS